MGCTASKVGPAPVKTTGKQPSTASSNSYAATPAGSHASYAEDGSRHGDGASRIDSSPAPHGNKVGPSPTGGATPGASRPVTPAKQEPLIEKRNLHELYVLGDILGKGGFGEVRRGAEKKTGKSVAIKMMSKIAFSSEVDYANMVSEVQAMKTVRGHRNVVQLIGAYEDKAHFWIVCELCTGGELMDRIIASSHFSEAVASKFFKQMLRGVKHCHDNNVVHRDLKPENFLMASDAGDADIKITDFGFACVLQQPDEIMSEALGSPYYVAPEIFKQRYTKAVDCWALGIILFLLLSGTLPFGASAESEKEVYSAIQNEDLQFGPEWNTVTSAARELISGLLQKNPKKRYTIDQALAHPWVSGGAAVDKPLDAALLRGLSAFNNKNKFRKTVLRSVANKLSAAEVRDLRTAFHKIDTDNTGFISYSELREALHAAGMDDSKGDIEKLMRQMDTDGDHRISWQEFLEATLEQQVVHFQQRLWEVFCEYDKDGSGSITLDELKQVLKGESDEAVERWMAEYDVDKDGTINYEEFLKMFFPKNTTFTRGRQLNTEGLNLPTASSGWVSNGDHSVELATAASPGTSTRSEPAAGMAVPVPA